MAILEKVENGCYKVIKNEALIGWLTKEHNKGTGRWARNYSGYIPPYNEWEYSPNNDDEPMKRFDTFKEAKEYLKSL